MASGSVGDFVGEYDDLGELGISPAKHRVREQM